MRGGATRWMQDVFLRFRRRSAAGRGRSDPAIGSLRRGPEAGPWRVGVGEAPQQIDRLPADPRDVVLAAVLTERGLQVF